MFKTEMIREKKMDEIKKTMNEFSTTYYDRVFTDEKFLSIEKYILKLNNERMLTREKLLKGGKDGSAVVIVPKLSNGEYLMVIEPRVFTSAGVGISFPAGYIEKEETPIESAKRELKEETGYVVDSDSQIRLLDSYYQDEGISSAYNHIFLFDGPVRRYEQNLDKDEIIHFISLNEEELSYLESINYINSANAKLALRKIL